MDERVPPVHPLFVLQVTTSCETYLHELENRLIECPGTVSVEVNEEIREVCVRGNVKPLDLMARMGEEAELCYYNKDPARIDDFKSKNNDKEKKNKGNYSKGKEKEKYSGRKKEEEDHYKPYVYKEHDPVIYPSSISGKEFFDYFRRARSENCKRHDVPMVDPYAEFPQHPHSKHFNSGNRYAEFPDHSRSKHFNSGHPYGFPDHSRSKHFYSGVPYAEFPDHSHSNHFNSGVPYAEFPDHSHSNHFNSGVPMRRSAYPPYFY